MLSKSLMFLVFFIFCQPVFAADEDVEINQALTACLDVASFTANMLDCTNKAYIRYDKKLNSLYGKLMTKLPQKDKETLRNAQRKWIEQRDLDFKLIDVLYSEKEGTMYQPMRAMDRLSVIKQRVASLSTFVGLVDGL
jgi:uncharacterized protein YecT (DUF1311 family)